MYDQSIEVGIIFTKTLKKFYYPLDSIRGIDYRVFFNYLLFNKILFLLFGTCMYL